MNSKTLRTMSSPLSRILPAAHFSEYHSGVVEAPIQTVWPALHGLRWSDLRIGGPLMALRGLLTPLGQDRLLETFVKRAGAIKVDDAPHSTLLVMIGKPWSPVPQHERVSSVAEVEAFDAPGWLKYGMEWQLHSLPGNRTLVETRTLCRATDPAARRMFRCYWTIIRVFSGLLRLDIIASLRRLSRDLGGAATGRGD